MPGKHELTAADILALGRICEGAGRTSKPGQRDQAQPTGRGWSLRDFLFREFRHDVAAGAGDAAHREGRRGAVEGRTRRLQSTDPQGPRTGRHLHDRNRRPAAPRPRAGGDSAASSRPRFFSLGLRKSRRCRRPIKTAPRPRARRVRCSSCTSRSREAQIAAFRQPGAQVILGFSHPAYSHMAVVAEATRAELAGDFD